VKLPDLEESFLWYGNCSVTYLERIFMKSNKLQRTLKGAGLALSLLFGIGALSSTTAQAQIWYPQDRQEDRRERRDDRRDRRQERREERRERRDDRWEDRNDRYGNNDRYRNNDRYGNGDYRNSASRVAQENGYRDGLRKGAEDARDRDGYNPQKNSEYKNGTSGYNSSYGSKGTYKQVYRDAFLRGYSEGYNRNGYRNNRRYGY
jgi:hypothetical protein